jgi:hypothetical protein
VSSNRNELAFQIPKPDSTIKKIITIRIIPNMILSFILHIICF